MRAVGTKRLVWVSSGGVNPRRDSEDGLIFNWIIKPILGKTTYEDMRRMEQLVTNSDMDWTIVRPGRLFDAQNVSSYQLEEDAYKVSKDSLKTSRADLAEIFCSDRQKNNGTCGKPWLFQPLSRKNDRKIS
jgi:putative NADH-flavin reductase